MSPVSRKAHPPASHTPLVCETSQDPPPGRRWRCDCQTTVNHPVTLTGWMQVLNKGSGAHPLSSFAPDFRNRADRMFSNVVFPAPLGPIIAVSFAVSAAKQEHIYASKWKFKQDDYLARSKDRVPWFNFPAYAAQNLLVLDAETDIVPLQRCRLSDANWKQTAHARRAPCARACRGLARSNVEFSRAIGTTCACSISGAFMLPAELSALAFF